MKNIKMPKLNDKVYIIVKNDIHHKKVGKVEKIIDDELWIKFSDKVSRRLWIYKPTEVMVTND